MKKLLGATSVRGVNYATSPLLASKMPHWRSRRYWCIAISCRAT